MSYYGYGGKILRIDLTKNEYKIENTDLPWFKDVIGGRAANSKRLLEELNTQCDPLGPDNLLIFGIGPLTGTLLPASAYFTVSAKSPMTGILGDSAAGGHFSAELKQAGFDQIIIKGKSEKLSYLFINDSHIECKECPQLKGKTILETTKIIRSTHRDFSIQVAAIGPAGENRVLFSSIVSSGNRVSGRTGMGAVMGSKNLKAVAVRGTQSICMADPLKMKEEADKIKHKMVKHREYNKRYRLGTTMLIKDLNNLGILATKHYQQGTCEYADKISGERLAENYKLKNKGCFNCNVHCSRYYACGSFEAEGPEFETLCSFTSKIGNSDLDFALEMNYYLNQMGLDSLSSGEIFAWLMECMEKGLVKPKDLNGWDLGWGEINKVRELLHLIVNREGIGDELASGATKFSKKFSREAQQLVMQVKGLDVICGDPRGIKAYGLTYAIASRGGDHLRAEPYFELTEDWDAARERFGTERAADRLAEDGKAALVTYSEKIALLTDCLTMCKNLGLCMDTLNFENSSMLLEACTGIKYEPKYLQSLLSKCIERDYILNKKFGVKEEEDTLPKRFLEEPLKEGASKGSIVNIKKMVREYNKLHNRKG